jgi:hypothetical protein
MTILLAIWLATFAVLLLAVTRRQPAGGALTLAYFVGLSLIHVPGALAFNQPLAPHAGRAMTILGFSMTVCGLVAFTVGALASSTLGRPRASQVRPRQALPQDESTLLNRGLLLTAIGLVSYFAILPFSSSVPSITSLVGGVSTLLVAGIWLLLYRNSLYNRPLDTGIILLSIPLLPLATIISGGFIGYGVYWVISIVAFIFVISRRRIWFYVAAPVAVVIGLSVFVTYMEGRSAIRDAVWIERASLSERVDRVASTFSKFEFINLGDPVQLETLNSRLNQNALVGEVVTRHRDGFFKLAHGATLAPWALIPRALWPGKPAVGGGGDLVATYTGLQFGEGTSVGAGQVLEFYVNFGVAGIIAGFLALGWLLMRLDIGVMRALRRGDQRAFLLCALPGFALLQPGGNLVAIVVAVVAAIVAALIIDLIFGRNRPSTRVPEHTAAPARR